MKFIRKLTSNFRNGKKANLTQRSKLYILKNSSSKENPTKRKFFLSESGTRLTQMYIQKCLKIAKRI